MTQATSPNLPAVDSAAVAEEPTPEFEAVVAEFGPVPDIDLDAELTYPDYMSEVEDLVTQEMELWSLSDSIANDPSPVTVDGTRSACAEEPARVEAEQQDQREDQRDTESEKDPEA